MKFKVGDRVYCKKYKKYGIVIKIDLEDLEGYPIQVRFKNKDIPEWYTRNGKWAFYEPNIVLIHHIREKLKKILKY